MEGHYPTEGNYLTLIFGLTVACIVLSIFVFLGGRLLGIRVSFLRAVISSLLGGVIGTALAGTTIQGGEWIALGMVVYILLITMGLMVLGELLAQPASLIRIQGQLRKKPHPFRALRLKIARMQRYMQIISIIARNGLSSYLSGPLPSGPENTTTPSRLALSLKNTLQDSGGIFVKMGQVLSTRQDLLPPQMIEELSSLQDSVPPEPYVKIREVLRQELGADPDQIFERFDTEPIASASIAQVYRAQLRSGEEVVVKVQRSDIRTLVERDVHIMLRLAETIEQRTTWGKEMQVGNLAQGFADALWEELDFQVEARNILTVAAALKSARDVVLPGFHKDLSSSRVLVMEWLDGSSVRGAEAIITEFGLDRTALARTLLGCFFSQIFSNGIFHADPHPGNILILRTGKLAIIDLGSVGRLDPLQLSALRYMLFAVQRNDSQLLTQAVLDIREGRDDIDEERLERALAHFMVQRLGANMPLDARVFTDLFALLQRYKIAFPPVIAGVFRSIVTLEGTLILLDSDFSLVDEARTLAPQFLSEEIKPGSLANAFTSEVLSLLPILRRLPRRLDRIATALERGTLTTKSRFFAHEQDSAFVRFLVGNLILAFLGAALGIMGVLLINMPGATTLVPGVTFTEGLGYLCLIFCAIFMMRVIVSIARDQVLARR